MSKFAKKIFFFLLFLLVIFIAGLLAWWGITQRQWPILFGAAMGAGVIACFLFILFLKNYLVRRRGKKLIEHIVEQGQVISEEALPDLLHVKELDKTWNANLALLRGSHLRSKGNPMYVLPWYIAMGATGVGKTTALDNSGLAASFTEVGQDSRTRGTRNCDWWFFDKAVILDTAGRYTIPVEGTADQDEWKHFLNLLAKHRKKEPLNGILLFFAADILTSTSADLLKKQGQFLRNRIDNLMRAIGYKIPVRVIVTKMDLVRGFSGFAKNFESAKRRQAMGYWNRKAIPFWQEVLDDAMRETGERLRELRKGHVLADGRCEADFLIFPKNFEELHGGLKSVLGPVFSENRFQETPYLAGVYFGSGQCGDPPIPASFSNAEPNQKNSEKGHAFFFADLFSQILTEGRERLEPVKEFLLWRRISNNLGLLTWWLFCFFCIGLIGLSFMHNQSSLIQANMIEVPSQSLALKDSNAVILGLEKLRLDIINLEKINDSNRLSRAGFNQENRAEKALKKNYCNLFESSLQHPMENGLSRALSGVNQNTEEHLIADYAGFTVEYINQIQNYLTSEPLPEVSSEFNPAAARILQFEDAATSSEVAAFFSDQNKSYLLWSNNRTGSLSRLKTVQSDLLKLLSDKIDNVSWLYHRLITKTDSIKLGDFWYHNIPKEYDEDETFSVLGAFTERGRQEIYKFIDLAKKAGDKEVAEKLRSRFEESYQSQFFSRWYTFAENFQIGRASLHQVTDWRETAIRMTTDSNPYFTLISTMAKELSSYIEDAKVIPPAWAEAVISFDNVLKQARLRRQTEEKNISSIAATVKTVKEQFVGKVTNQVELLRLVSAWEAYDKALTALEAATPYKEKTFQLIGNWFREAVNPGDKASLYGTAYQAIGTLHGLAKGKYDNSLAWRFVEGPFDFLTEFGLRESALVLQEQWTEQVVAQAETVDKDKLLGFLFEKDSGMVWKFIKDSGGPFLQKTVYGYQSRDVFGRSLIFEPSLYTFLDQGADVIINRQADYRVELSNRPMEVNRDAVQEPYASIITVQCADDEIVLENDNYPRTQNFTWSPDKCGDVNLTIEFPDVTLHKNYPGKMAFAHFLNNFIDGALRFTPEDFPEETGHLRNANIKEIVLTYSVRGQEPVLRLLELKPIVPEVITVPEQQHGGAVFN